MKNLLLVLAALPTLANAAPKKVLMFLNEGFQAQEYYEPREIFEQAGFKISVAARYAGSVAPGKKYTNYPPAQVDITFDQVDLSKYDGITFAGGSGAWEDFFPNPQVHKILADAFKRNMVVGLLCASTGVLATANNLDGQSMPIAEGRNVTGYYQVEGLLRRLGKVNFDPGEKGKPHVVVDRNLITGRDPESSALFGKTVAEKLQGKFNR
jgi:protease I